MRSVAAAALALALAACGGGEGGELAASNSQLSQAQIDSALGPADQSAIEDAIRPQSEQNALEPSGNHVAAGIEDEG